MTTELDIVNRALQEIGTRTTIASLTEQSNEAIQASLIIDSCRDEILRMAPWQCAKNFINLVYITSAPGTPENTTGGTATWQKGQPPPSWAYEYQYPVDCLKALWVVPQLATGFAGGVPITTAVTGGSPGFWNGPPVRFVIGVDQFYTLNQAAFVSAGSGYAVGDFFTLAGTPPGQAPIGAPATLQVSLIGGGGSITSAAIIPAIAGNVNTAGGSYFRPQTNPLAQGSTTGAGTGVQLSGIFSANPVDQRVIYTNQQQAILSYVRQVTDPNVMDPLFVSAWQGYLSARLVMALTGDKALANTKLQESNEDIRTARAADANETLTINDVTPDWIRARGIAGFPFADTYNAQYDWGPLLTLY